jgi:hypothetical protein
MMRRQSVLNLMAFSLRWMSVEEAPSLRVRGCRSSTSSESGSRAKAIEHAPIIATAMEIRRFIILETSDAREASNATWKFSIRTRRFSSRDNFFI